MFILILTTTTIFLVFIAIYSFTRYLIHPDFVAKYSTKTQKYFKILDIFLFLIIFLLFGFVNYIIFTYAPEESLFELFLFDFLFGLPFFGVIFDFILTKIKKS